MREDTIAHNILEHVSPGQIVVAGDSPGSSAMDNTVDANTVVGSSAPGIMVHSDGTGAVVSGNVVRDNVLEDNGDVPQFGLTRPAGIAVIGNHSPVLATTVSGNTVSGDPIGVWEARATGVTLAANAFHLTPGGSAVVAVSGPLLPTSY